MFFIFCTFLSVLGYSQKKVSEELNLEIICGSGAYTAGEIQTFKYIVDRKDTLALRNKLFAGSRLEEVLAAITLKYLQSVDSIHLTQEENKKFDQISKYKDRFSLCFTCTFQQEGMVKDLFNRKKYSASYEIIESFLFNRF